MSDELPKGLQKWARTRQKGKWRFVLTCVLCWGIPMFVVMTFFLGPQSDAPVTVNRIIGSAVIWLVGGMLFGLLAWEFAERRYRKSAGDAVDSE